MSLASLFPLFVAGPWVAAFLISVTGRKVERLSEIVGVVIPPGLFVLALGSLRVVWQQNIFFHFLGGWKPPVVRADLEAYARSPLVRHDIPVRGFVFDVKTGRVHEVARRPLARAAGA